MFLFSFLIVLIVVLHCLGQGHTEKLEKLLHETKLEDKEIVRSLIGSNLATGNSSERAHDILRLHSGNEVRVPTTTETTFMARKRESFYKRKREDTNEGTDEFQFHPWKTEKFWAEFKKKIRDEGFDLTRPEDNPFAVYLAMPGGKMCSGTLLTQRWVLTAAHCLAGKTITPNSRVEICAGGISFHDCKHKLKRTQLQYSSTYHIHNEFLLHERVDLAVLKTDKRFQRTKTVDFAELSNVGWSTKTLQMCTITGFGKVEKLKNSAKDFKRKTHSLVVEAPCSCYEKRKKKLKNKICSLPRKDYGACKGDSGSGLLCWGRIVGVLSQSTVWRGEHCEDIGYEKGGVPECGSNNSVNTFTMTYPYQKWIYEYVPGIMPLDRKTMVKPSKSGSSTSPAFTLCMVFHLFVLILHSYVDSL